MIRSLVVILAFSALSALSTPNSAYGQNSASSSEQSQDQSRGPEKLQLDKLEKKYWSAKDDNFRVVQNRVYSKEGRVAFSLLHGYLVNDSFTEGTMSAAGLGYYFNEHWGLEATYFVPKLNETEAISRVARLGSRPDFSFVTSSATLAANWVPFYAKMSVLDKTIIYFDMAFGLGVGQTGYDIQTDKGNQARTSTHVSLDVTQYYYMNTSFALRLDFKHQIYQQERLRYELNSGEAESARELPTVQYQNTIMTVGLTYFF